MNRSDVLFDDISRVLASSIPRRQALRLVVGGIGGVILTAVWPSRFAYADGKVIPCNGFCFFEGGVCAPGLVCTDKRFCCDPGTHICGLDSGPECCECKGRTCCKDDIHRGECCECCATKGTAPCCNLKENCCINGKCIEGNPCAPKICCGGAASCCDPETQFCCHGNCCKKKVECCVRGMCVPTPAGKISSWRGGPPTQVQMTFRDAAQGLATVTTVKAVNVKVDISPFKPGTKDPVVATLTKIDQAQHSHFLLEGCCGCGCCKGVDPVVTELKLNTGRWARQRFGSLHEEEYFVTVQNGHFGLHELTIDMNGKLFELRRLRDGERRDINVSSAMVEGGHNVVILTGRGQVGASANIMISDTKVEPGPSANIAAEIMGAHLGPGMERLRAHQNMVWGDLVEEAEETTHLAFAESSGQTAQVVFGGRMDLNSVSELARYEVEVNGRPARVEIVEPYIGSDSVTITLRLANRELRTGDRVTVFWDGLLNDAGHLVSGHVGPLIVRSLQ